MINLYKEILEHKYNLCGYNKPYDFFTGYSKNRSKYQSKHKKHIFIVGIPEHGNIGDQAIFISMLQFLRKNYVDYDIHKIYFSRILENLRCLIKYVSHEDMFVLMGGGNMGNEYLDEEEVRRIVIKYFPLNRIIIFPQTLDFSNKRESEESARIFEKHRDLHIFSREKVSYQKMQEIYSSNNIYIVPDIVLYLNKIPFMEEMVRNDILLCIRNDRESSITIETESELINLSRKYAEKIRYTDTVMSYLPDIFNEEVVSKVVYRKLIEFRKASVVITDRLHGMIFSAICATPCLVLENYNHKVSSFYYTWFQKIPYIHLYHKEESMEMELEKLLTLQKCEDVLFEDSFTPLKNLGGRY